MLAVVIPSANTPEERAAAYGETFDALELIDRAKKNYAEFKDGRGRIRDWARDWGRDWRRQHRQWRRQFHQTMREERWGFRPAVAPPAGYAACMVAGFMVPVLSLVSAAFFWLCAYAVLSLVTLREAFGISLPEDIPLWAGILILGFLSFGRVAAARGAASIVPGARRPAPRRSRRAGRSAVRGGRDSRRLARLPIRPQSARISRSSSGCVGQHAAAVKSPHALSCVSCFRACRGYQTLL